MTIKKLNKVAYFAIFTLTLLNSCSQSKSKEEKAIIEFIETNKGVRTDLDVKLISVDISEIKVSDSIKILNEKFNIEKQKKIESAEKMVAHYKESIAEAKDDIVGKTLKSKWKKELFKAETELKNAQEWEPNYKNNYANKNPEEVLVKKAICVFSFMNPLLKTRQETKKAFILNENGTECLKMIKVTS